MELQQKNVINKHKYLKLKEILDLIKVNPCLIIDKKTYHNNETDTHFQLKFLYWGELNLSKEFVEFRDEVEDITQSLAQIIYHKKDIFDALMKGVLACNTNSLEPLLELSEAFIHDLGLDFIEFFDKFIETITNVCDKIGLKDIQNKKNTSNVLEWVFRCLGFSFKYLIKPLVNDITKTFEMLFPLFILKKKTYMSLFSAEIFSIIIKKLDSKHLTDVVKYSLNDKIKFIEENDSYRNTLIHLYTKSMVGTKGFLHSRYETVLIVLFQHLINSKSPDIIIYIIKKILINLIMHASSKSCESLYHLIINYISEFLQNENGCEDFFFFFEIISTIISTDAKKIPIDWDSILKIYKLFLKKLDVVGTKLILKIRSFVYLTVLILDNSDISFFMKNYQIFVETMIKFNNGDYYFFFIDWLLHHFKDLKGSFIDKNQMKIVLYDSVQNNHNNNLIKFSFFLLRNKDIFCDLNHKNYQTSDFVEVVHFLKTSVFDIADINTSFEVYSKLIILNSFEVFDDYDIFLKNLDQILKSNYKFNFFSIDFLNLNLELIIRFVHSEKIKIIIPIVFNKLVSFFESLVYSSKFIQTFEKFLKHYFSTIFDLFKSKHSILLSILMNSLCHAASSSRINLINLIITIYDLLKIQNIDILYQIKEIESIKINNETSRIFCVKLRNFVTNFLKLNINDNYISTLVLNYFFGLLSNRLLICSKIVLELLPSLIKISPDKIFELCYKILILNHKDLNSSFCNFDVSYLNNDFLLSNKKELNILKIEKTYNTSFEDLFNSYQNTKFSIIQFYSKDFEKISYNQILKENCILFLTQNITFFEKFLNRLVDLFLENFNTDISIDDCEKNFEVSIILRDKFLNLFTQFKNLKSCPKADQLYDYALNVLSQKNVKSQELALKFIFSFNKGLFIDYQEILLNFFNDNLFYDEIIKILSLLKKKDVNNKQLDQTMDLILRILFGFIQRFSRKNLNSKIKFVFNEILTALPEKFVIDFLTLGFYNLNCNNFFVHQEINFHYNHLTKIHGFINLLNQMILSLKKKFNAHFYVIVDPLIYSLTIAQKKIDTDALNNDDSVDMKLAKIIRVKGIKCFNQTILSFSDSFDWSNKLDLIYNNLIRPRLSNFISQNLQLNSFLQFITNCIKLSTARKIYYYEDLLIVKSLVLLFENENTDELVMIELLNFFVNALNLICSEDQYKSIIKILVDSLLMNLPGVIEKFSNNNIFLLSVNLVLLLAEKDYINVDQKNVFFLSLLSVLTKLVTFNNSIEKSTVLITFKSLLDLYNFDEIYLIDLFKICAKYLRFSDEKKTLDLIINVFESIGNKISYLNQICIIIKNLNSFSENKIQEFDYHKRLDSFKLINETLYLDLSRIQWLPIINCSLRLILVNDSLIRSNASFTIMRFIDCFSNQSEKSLATEYIKDLTEIVLPFLRSSLKSMNEDLRSSAIDILHHLVSKSNYYDNFDSMKVLLSDNEETNFFLNIKHIQLHRRLRSIKRLKNVLEKIDPNLINFYILPILITYSSFKEVSYLNIVQESIETISFLIRFLKWNHLTSFFIKYLSNLTDKNTENLKYNIKMIGSICKGFSDSTKFKSENENSNNFISVLPSQEVVTEFIINKVVLKITKIMKVRDDTTILDRLPLSKSILLILLSVDIKLVETHFEDIIISLCQVMRSRSQELRNAVRKSMNECLLLLGPKYLNFFLKFLKLSLTRGSQIHVLSYNVFSLLNEICNNLKHGDLDDSVQPLYDIIMEDIFGSSGKEKDVDGYTSKMIEVKLKKSFDSLEIISSNINLNSFYPLFESLKLLLVNDDKIETQKKVDNLLTKCSQGLLHNESSKTHDILIFCYECFELSNIKSEEEPKILNEATKHFIVNSNSQRKKNLKLHNLFFFKVFSLTVLKNTISFHEKLKTVSNLEGFIPILKDSIESDNVKITVISLKLLNIFLSLKLPEKYNPLFKSCARRALNFIKDSASTNMELCQVSLKFLSTCNNYSQEIHLKTTALNYILSRIMSDLEEFNVNKIAFKFIKSLLSQHIEIPNLYDVMIKISEMMIRNLNKEIRDVCKNLFFQFLMEYSHGTNKLKKHFQFLIDNLKYPSEEGRQTIIQLIHLLIIKSSPIVSNNLIPSFFIALSNLLVTDESTKSQNMTSLILLDILKKSNEKNIKMIEEYIYSWISNTQNYSLKICGLKLYKIYVTNFSYDKNNNLNLVFLKNLLHTLILCNEKTNTSIFLNLLHTCLNVFLSIFENNNIVFKKEFEDIWKSIFHVLNVKNITILKDVNQLLTLILSNLKDLQFKISSSELQTIAHNLISIFFLSFLDKKLLTLSLNNLLIIFSKCEKEKIHYESMKIEDLNKQKHELISDYILSQLCSILKQKDRLNFSNDLIKSILDSLIKLVLLSTPLRLAKFSEVIIESVFSYTEIKDDDENKNLLDLSKECLQEIQKKLNTTVYSKLFSSIKLKIDLKRERRKQKKEYLKVIVPEINAKRKMKKHLKEKKKRKMIKDENGYFHSKKKIRKNLD